MFKHFFIAIILLWCHRPALHAQINYAVVQCISGECANGEGVADLEGFHVYRGNFKNSKPEGKGMVLRYEQSNELPEYIGEFKNGIANGTGVQMMETNKIYAEGTFADGWFNKGEIHFENRWTAKINKVTTDENYPKYTGTLYDGTTKKNDFSNFDIYALKEKMYPKQDVAGSTVNPNLGTEISADMKTLTNVFESKFDLTDRVYVLYMELLDCLPDDFDCAENRNDAITSMIQFYTEQEARDLDKTVNRLFMNIAEYRNGKNINEKQRKDAGEVLNVFNRLKGQYIEGFAREVVSNIRTAVKDAQNESSKGGISVMRVNARVANSSRKESRERIFEIWKSLTAIF